MQRIGFCTCLLLLLLAGLAGLSAQSKIPPPRYLTDQEQIHILLHRLREGIKQQDLLLITDGFAPEIETDDSTSVTLAAVREQLRAAFTVAETRVYFGAAAPDSSADWQFGRKHRETIRFQKVGGEWRVKGVGRLINLLSL